MLPALMAKLGDPQFLMMVLAAIAAAATVLTIAMPLLDGDVLGKRMKAVAIEREQIRARERERMNRQSNEARPSLRQAAQGLHEAGRRPAPAREMAGHGKRQEPARPWPAIAGRRPRSASCSSAW